MRRPLSNDFNLGDRLKTDSKTACQTLVHDIVRQLQKHVTLKDTVLTGYYLRYLSFWWFIYIYISQKSMDAHRLRLDIVGISTTIQDASLQWQLRQVNHLKHVVQIPGALVRRKSCEVEPRTNHGIYVDATSKKNWTILAAWTVEPWMIVDLWMHVSWVTLAWNKVICLDFWSMGPFCGQSVHPGRHETDSKSLLWIRITKGFIEDLIENWACIVKQTPCRGFFWFN